MNGSEPVFVIPTYRLRDVGETVRAYDEHFRCNGHAISLMVFDDSSLANQQKYLPMLESVGTTNPLYYVGPQEKEAFQTFLFGRLRDRKLEPLVRNLFRPGYGGNRNCTLIYTLGHLMITADEDMRPSALVEDSPESLGEGEVCRGRLVRSGQNGITMKSFDILSAFREVLGKTVGGAPPNYDRGEMLIDSAMDLETNASFGLAHQNVLTLQSGCVPDDATVKMAQAYRSGTNDLDALDFATMFLDDQAETSPDALNQQYVLVNFRPVITKKNWRLDCGVAAYDTRLGLPPFFPTRLRFEDYIHRLWIQRPGVAAAHVDAAQHHTKNNYMRNPLASEIFNEEVANLLKNKIRRTLVDLGELSISFDYDGEVTQEDSEEILTRIRAFHQRALDARQGASSAERREALAAFAAGIERAFYGFEPNFFQQNLVRIVDDVISLFKGCLEIWPTIVEICYLQKDRALFPARCIGGA